MFLSAGEGVSPGRELPHDPPPPHHLTQTHTCAICIWMCSFQCYTQLRLLKHERAFQFELVFDVEIHKASPWIYLFIFFFCHCFMPSHFFDMIFFLTIAITQLILRFEGRLCVEAQPNSFLYAGSSPDLPLIPPLSEYLHVHKKFSNRTQSEIISGALLVEWPALSTRPILGFLVIITEITA